MEEIAKEDEEKQIRHMRRVVAKQEKLKARPPRLGKHKYARFLKVLILWASGSFSVLFVVLLIELENK